METEIKKMKFEAGQRFENPMSYWEFDAAQILKIEEDGRILMKRNINQTEIDRNKPIYAYHTEIGLRMILSAFDFQFVGKAYVDIPKGLNNIPNA